jgi:carbon-monoxide dehydrogenase iron sulfur subunit
MSQPSAVTRVWVARDYAKCSGCRICEIACSLQHEGRIWPEASMVRVFMFFPGLEVPHLCTQCHDYPCVASCPFQALGVNEETGAVEVYMDKCNACGACIEACPGRVPHLHPNRKYIVICDLCGGDPRCARVCTKLGYDCLSLSKRGAEMTYDLYAVKPMEVAKNLALNLYGDEGREVI